MENTGTDYVDETMNNEFKIKLCKMKKQPTIYKPSFTKGIIQPTLTFNDVLLVPQYSEVQSRSQCSVVSKFSHNIPLNIPIVSSPMDTVTETDMAIEMARQGGLGIIHRFMPIQQQVQSIQKVKRAGVFINMNPCTVSKNDNFATVKKLMERYDISSFIVAEASSKSGQESPRLSTKRQTIYLDGILTHRDINRFTHDDQLVKDFMTTRQNMSVYEVQDSFKVAKCDLNSIMNECKKTLISKKVQKIPLVNSKNQVLGLVSLKDIQLYESLKVANKDPQGRLFVGASVGANKDYIERATSLRDAGCDVLVIDVANGHSKLALDATQQLKSLLPNVDIVAGSIATGQGAENLIRSGADGIRCGIGNGSICITRVVAGSGVPQLSALLDTVPVCQHYGVPLCSDGGNKNSGNMCKALSVGANSVMVGRLVAGCQESPGVPFYKDGKFVKIYRGMAGLGANISKSERTGGDKLNPQTFSSEGVQGYIPFTGPLKYILQGFTNGIRSGMSYSGAFNLKQLKEKSKLIQISSSGFEESNVHGITQFK